MSSGSQFLGWFYPLDGTKIGPLTSEELIGLVKAGKLHPDDAIWKAWAHNGEVTYYRTYPAVALGKWEGYPR
jgi:GYF domain 2